MARRAAGFTLIEVLVVMTIIAALMGMVVLFVSKAATTKEMALTTQRLNGIRMGIEHLKQPHLYGMYPSADMLRLKGLKGEEVGKIVGISNRTNVGIETLYVALFLSTHDFALKDMNDEWLGNTDSDTMKGNPTRSGKPDLYEFVDAWGNPFAYLSQWDYKQPDGLTDYVMGDGTTQSVKPWKSEKTGQFINSGTFQLFSAGPDLVFNTDDDIGNW